jgi:hypothetical protein
MIIDALLSLPLASLLTLAALLLLVVWVVAIALTAGNGPDDDDDPVREMDRVDSIRAGLQALESADASGSVWQTGTGERRRKPAGTVPADQPAQAPFGDTPRIDVDVWSQP